MTRALLFTPAPRPMLELFREGYDMKTIADVYGVPDEHVEQVIRTALTHIGGTPSHGQAGGR